MGSKGVIEVKDIGQEGILRIEFPPGIERARRVVSRSNAHPTGRFPSIRQNRMMEWDSRNELNAFRLLEVNHEVRSYREQPCVITYRLEGEEHKHYPDVLVETSQGRFLWEIKPENVALRTKVLTRSQFMQERLPRFGYTYQVVIAEDLRREPRMTNVQFVLRHGRKKLSFAELEHARSLFAAHGNIPWESLGTGPFEHLSREIACRLILEGIVITNLDVERSQTRMSWSTSVFR